MFNFRGTGGRLKSLLRSFYFIAISVLIHIALALALLASPHYQPATKKINHELVITLSTETNEGVVQHTRAEHSQNELEPTSSSNHQSTVSEIGFPPAVPTNRFYEIHDLDNAITPISDIYPEANEEIEGKMTLDLYLDESGKVTSASIHESTLPEELGKTLMKSFLHQDFEQGKIKGVPVKVHLRVKLEISSRNRSPN
jgi:TonB family protein